MPEKPSLHSKELHQFLGLASYYRRFVHAFARVAAPLHAVTRKSAPFKWTSNCQAVDQLRSRLVTAPVLADPDFKRDFILETDVDINGLGAVLSQTQEDGKVHPVAYASRVLSLMEKNYAITELETLAVVRAVTHSRYYLYGHNVRIFTDHTAVKAALGTPQPNGKHTWWWSWSSTAASRRWRLCTDLAMRMLMPTPYHTNPIWMHHSRGLLV